MLKIFSFVQNHRCIFRVVILAFLWIVSLIYGVCISLRDLSVVVLMRLVPFDRVSIVGLFAVLILPLLISIICFYYRRTIVIYTLSMLKGFCVGYCTGGIASAYGSAGWLIEILFFFSDFFANIILHLFWFRQIYRDGSNLKKDSIGAILAASIVGIIDYFAVVPFTVSLANQL